MAIFKDRIVEHLNKIQTVVFGRTKMLNEETVLSQVFLWQEVCKLAKKNLELAWKATELEEDDLRNLGVGEHIALESGVFSCIAKVGDGRSCFNKDKFILAVAKKHKIPVASLTAIAEKCKDKTKPVLEKRVLEAS